MMLEPVRTVLRDCVGELDVLGFGVCEPQFVDVVEQRFEHAGGGVVIEALSADEKHVGAVAALIHKEATVR